MRRKQSSTNLELQEILNSHMHRVFYWCLVPFAIGAVLLIIGNYAGWVACLGSLFFWAFEAFAAHFRKSMTLRELRENLQYTNGLFRGLCFGLFPLLGSNLARLQDMDQAIWLFVVFSILILIFIYLQEKLMRQTAALLDEPTG